jgi:hypothetical protein
MFTKRYIFRITIMYMIMPGTMQNMNPIMVRRSMNQGMGGFASNVALRPDCVVALHFSVEKNCTALVTTSSAESEVLTFDTESAIDATPFSCVSCSWETAGSLLVY